MLTERKSSITVTAFVGTGLVTLGVALTGMAGMSSDLRAANRTAVPTTPAPPLLTPTDEVGDSLAAERRARHLPADCEHWREQRQQVTGTANQRDT